MGPPLRLFAVLFKILPRIVGTLVAARRCSGSVARRRHGADENGKGCSIETAFAAGVVMLFGPGEAALPQLPVLLHLLGGVGTEQQDDLCRQLLRVLRKRCDASDGAVKVDRLTDSIEPGGIGRDSGCAFPRHLLADHVVWNS